MSHSAHQESASQRGSGRLAGSVRLWGTALLLALFAAGMWFAWLGWDHQYYEVKGVPQGPYRAWQVIGCGLSIAVAAVLAYLWVRRSVAIVVLAGMATVGFAIPWSMDASRSDDTGMWGVGLMFLLVGGGAGLAALLAITQAVTGPRMSTTSALLLCGGVAVVLLFAYPPLAIVPLAVAAWVLVRRWLPERHNLKHTA